MPPTQLHLVVLPLSPHVEHSLHLLDWAVIVDGASSVFLEEGETGFGCGVSLEGVEVGTRGGVRVVLVDGAVAAAFRFTFLLARGLAWIC